MQVGVSRVLKSYVFDHHAIKKGRIENVKGLRFLTLTHKNGNENHYELGPNPNRAYVPNLLTELVEETDFLTNESYLNITAISLFDETKEIEDMTEITFTLKIKEMK